LNFYKDESTREGIGEVKILHGDLKITELDSHFTELGVTFCSLGQTLAYYKNLRENFPSEFMAIATALRDCVLVGGIKVGVSDCTYPKRRTTYQYAVVEKD